MRKLISIFCAIVSSVSVSNNKDFSLFVMGWTKLESVAKDNNNNVIMNDKKVISLPLIPNHVVEERRRRSRRYNNRRRLDMEKKQITENVGRMKLNKNSSGVLVGSLYQGYGTHYVDLWCGSPPQRQTVIVDTGSSATAFPCDGCQDCGEGIYHTDELYNQNLSSTFHRLTCEECTRARKCYLSGEITGCKYSVSYMEGSKWTAFEARDVCYITGPHNMPLPLLDMGYENKNNNKLVLLDQGNLDPVHASSFEFELIFGCQAELAGLFKTQLADGVMGMNNAQGGVFWKQMYNAGKISDPTFSLCFTRSNIIDRKGTEAGVITLGGIDKRLHKTTMIYTSGTPSSEVFTVKVRKVYLQEGVSDASLVHSHLQIHEVDIPEDFLPRDVTVVDSGTSDILLHKKIIKPFTKLWDQLNAQEKFGDLVSHTETEFSNYPTLIIQMEGDVKLNSQIKENLDTNSSLLRLAGILDKHHPYDVLLVIPPMHYMEYDENEQTYFKTIYFELESNILGANAMVGHDIAFDTKRNIIGWAESDCNYSNLLIQNGYGAPIWRHQQDVVDDREYFTDIMLAIDFGYIQSAVLFLFVAFGVALFCKNVKSKNTSLPCHMLYQSKKLLDKANK